MRVAGGKGIKRLPGHRIKDWIDRIGIRGLHAAIGLETKPYRIVLTDVVVNASRLHLFVVGAGTRNPSPVRATVAEWASKNRQGRSGGVTIQRKHLLVERDQLRRGRID